MIVSLKASSVLFVIICFFGDFAHWSIDRPARCWK